MELRDEPVAEGNLTAWRRPTSRLRADDFGMSDLTIVPQHITQRSNGRNGPLSSAAAAKIDQIFEFISGEGIER